MIYKLILFVLTSQIEAEWVKPWTEQSELRSITMGMLKGRQNGNDFTPYVRYKDFGPHTYINVGTPGNYAYQFSFRLNHQNAWLVDPSFTDYNNQPYDPKNSTTSKVTNKQFSENYGSAKLTGKQISDKFWPVQKRFPGINSNFTQLFNNLVQLQNNLTLNKLLSVFEEGFIGYGWDTSNNDRTLDENSPPIFHILNGLQRRFFTFWSARLSINEKQVTYVISETSYGQQANTSLCEPKIQYVPFNKQSISTFQIDAFNFDKYSTKKSQKAWIDTEAFWLGLPSEQYRAVYKVLKPEYNEFWDILTVDCSLAQTAPNITFTLNGVDFAVKAEKYVSDVWFTDGKCALLIAENKDPSVDVVLGTPFARSYCITFDVDKNSLGLSTSLPWIFNPDE